MSKWELTSSDWMFLDKLVVILEPFRQACIQLEVDTQPTGHIAGRVLLWLLYAAPPIEAKHNLWYVEQFVTAARNKLVEFLDDPSYLVELAAG